MLGPERQPLAQQVDADETYVGGPRRGKPGRGAPRKTPVAGALQPGRGKAGGRRLGRDTSLANPGFRPPPEPCVLPKAVLVIARAKDVSQPDN